MSAFLESMLTKIGSMPTKELPTPEISAGVTEVSKTPKHRMPKKAAMKAHKQTSKDKEDEKLGEDVALLKKKVMMK